MYEINIILSYTNLNANYYHLEYYAQIDLIPYESNCNNFFESDLIFYIQNKRVDTKK